MLPLKGYSLVMIMLQHLLLPRPTRRQKCHSEDEGLIDAFKSVGDMLSNAIEKVAIGDTDVPYGVFDNLLNLPSLCSILNFR